MNKNGAMTIRFYCLLISSYFVFPMKKSKENPKNPKSLKKITTPTAKPPKKSKKFYSIKTGANFYKCLLSPLYKVNYLLILCGQCFGNNDECQL